MTPREWGVDFVFFSWYKIYSAHTASLYISPRATRERKLLTKLNHHFLHGKEGTYPYQPSSQQYELIAATARVVEYLSWIGKAAAGSKGPEQVAWKEAFESGEGGGVYGAKSTNGSGAKGDASALRAQLQSDLEQSFAAISAHEQALLEVLMAFLTSKEMRELGIRVVGNEAADSSVRAPTVAFVIVQEDGKGSKKKCAELQQRVVRDGKLGLQQGHMYAYALVEGLGLPIDDGVVRVSFVHYNSVEEVKRICALVEEAVRSL